MVRKQKPSMISVEMAARRLGITHAKAWVWVRDGKLDTERLNGRIVVPVGKLETLNIVLMNKAATPQEEDVGKMIVAHLRKRRQGQRPTHKPKTISVETITSQARSVSDHTSRTRVGPQTVLMRQYRFFTFRFLFDILRESFILTKARTSGSDGSIGSFAGARALNDLLPLLYGRHHFE